MENQKIRCPLCGKLMIINFNLKTKLVNETKYTCDDCKLSAHGIFNDKGELITLVSNKK